MKKTVSRVEAGSVGESLRGVDLTSLAAIIASGNVDGAFLGHVLALAVTALHGLSAVPHAVAALATGANKRLRALVNPVTLIAAVSATERGSVGAVLAHVTFFTAVTTLTTEDSGVGAVGLIVAVNIVSSCSSGMYQCADEAV